MPARSSWMPVETSTLPPSTPMICAETPTQMWPWRMISSDTVMYSASASTPPLTLSHSMITVPLAMAGSVGRRTTMRVRYSAEVVRSRAQYPSSGRPASPRAWAVAVPVAKYSTSS
jgi:hypothetical protein